LPRPPRLALLAALAGLPLACAAPLPEATSAQGAPPRLLVLVAVDQCRAEYLDRFLPALPEGGGFRRLLAGGAVYERAAHTHTVTSTGPGHAALSTGCLPARAGIPENEWIDRATGRRVYCVADPAGGYSTVWLQRPTLGDVLQDELGEAAHVVSISFKDRTALLLGGRRSDASVWLDAATGRWVGPRAAGGEAAAWIAQCNAAPDAPGPVARHAGRTWETAVPDALAARLAGPDDAGGEDRDGRLGATFPHRMPERGAAFDSLWYRVAVSPYCDEIVLEAALAALRDGGLGRDALPDLLCVGFAGMDNVGHAFGPDSRETLEAFVALDRYLALLLDALDETVGAGRWTLALSSDHGIAPVPEQSGGLRLVRGPLERALEHDLVARYGTPPGPDGEGARWLQGIAKPSVYLDHARIEGAGLDVQDVAEHVARALADRPGIAGAWTRSELAGAGHGASPDVAALARDVHPERSGDVLFLLTQGTVFTGAVATDHGSHHAYDRDVPLLLYGAGVVPGRYGGPAAPIDIAPTLARLAGLTGLADADGHALHEALVEAPTEAPVEALKQPLREPPAPVARRGGAAPCARRVTGR
jgi:predicted AlkP superfamily pyrophosphatase or phosphodiesterase